MENLSQVKKNLSQGTVYIYENTHTLQSPHKHTHYKTLTNTHITKPSHINTHTHTHAHAHAHTHTHTHYKTIYNHHNTN